MNNTQTNKLNMYAATDTFFENNYALITGSAPIMEDIINDFREVKVLIVKESKKQGVKVTGITIDKTDAKMNLALLTSAIAASVKSYAHRNGLQELAKKVHFTQGELEHEKDADIITNAKIVYDEAGSILTGLVKYNVNADKLQSLLYTIDLFEKLTGKRGSTTADHTTATQTLNILFHKADHIIRHQADEQMLSLKPEHARLYAEYINVRQLINLGSHKKKEKKQA